MKIGHNWKWSVVLATALGVGMYGAVAKISLAHGGGHSGGHGEEHHEADHHETNHHEADHHEAEHHPYHPTEHHLATHDPAHHDDHHDDHHWHHHHQDWHYAGWGWHPGFWGGLGLGYAAGWGTGGWGGNTYIDNSGSSNTPDSIPAATENPASTLANVADNAPSNDNTAQAANTPEKLPVDVWPELGISTYSGEYGQSKGLVVVRVLPHGAAERAGLKPGDVILKFDGQPTPDDETLESILDAAHGNFKLLVWDARSGRKNVISGTLDANNDADAEKNAG